MTAPLTVASEPATVAASCLDSWLARHEADLSAVAAHREAGKWEHVLSDSVEGAMNRLLGGPTTCPHGNPIPGLGVLAPDEFPLDRAQTGEYVIIQRITEEAEVDLLLMRYLQEHGVAPGARMRVHEASGATGLLVLEGELGQVPLGLQVAAKLRARRA